MHIIKSSFHINNPDEQNSHLSHILIPLEANNGYVFGLIRFVGKAKQTQTRIAQIIEERLLGFKDTINDGVNVARRFEQLLQALNEDIEQISTEERQFPITDAHVIIGVIHANQVFISGIGNLCTLFMHRSAKQRYVIYELSEQLKDKDGASWKRLFSTVLDGELHQGDVFYIATKVSAREITSGEMQDILTTLPASGSLKRIQQFLYSDTVYGALCFQIADEQISGAPKKVNPTHSMNHLDNTKKNTANILGESAPDITGSISKITSLIVKKLSAPGTRGYKSLLKRVIKLIIQLLSLLLVGCIKVLALLSKYAQITIKNIPWFVKTGSSIIKEQPSPRARVNQAINWFNSLPMFTKYGGLALIVIISVLTSTLLIMHNSEAQKEAESTFNTIASNIEEKISASEASLIYDDETQAKTHLQEAMTLLQTLVTNSGSQEDRIAELGEKLQALSYDIQKITPVEMSAVAQNNELNLTSAVQIQGIIYGIYGKNIYRLNELESTWQAIQTQSGNIGDVASTTSTDGNEFLFTDSTGQLGRADISLQTLNPIVSGADKIIGIDDIQFYNDNLYILTASGNQIIKMRPQGDGYEAGTPWITSTLSGTSLSNARSITIDGNIYVLTNSTVLSFLSGRQQSFDVSSISPAMHNPTYITTTDEGNYIYILEPDEKRVIVLDKQGKLVAQYINDEIANAKTMFVTESSIVIITNTTAYTFIADLLN